MLRFLATVCSLLVVILLLLVAGDWVSARGRQTFSSCANGSCSVPMSYTYQLAVPEAQPLAKADFCSGCTCLTCRCVLGECGQQFVSAGDVTSMLAPSRQSFMYSLPAESIDRRFEGRRSRSGFFARLFRLR